MEITPEARRPRRLTQKYRRGRWSNPIATSYLIATFYLGATLISLKDAYHYGFVVADIHSSMKEFSTLFGVDWTAIEDRELPVVTPNGATKIQLRFAYSIGSAPYIELLEPIPGTVWEKPTSSASDLGANHHVGVWAGNFADTSDKLDDAGLKREMTFNDGSGRASKFAYHRMPNGALIEIVDSSRRPQLEAWLQGAAYPADR